GGMMGIVTDRTAIQFRMLNRSKGPAMWSPRAQSDRMAFSAQWRHILENTPGLSIWQDTVARLIIDGDGHVGGVVTAMGMTFHAPAVVLTAGTFLDGLMHIGPVKIPGGRVSEPASNGLTQQLVALGLESGRMKTGTPPRLDGRTIHWELTSVQEADPTAPHHHFSYIPGSHSSLPQRPCFTTSTNAATHEVLRRGLPDSPLYNGQIKSIGPRYCPSIETKIVTFADKDSHPLFLEPEGADTTEYYINGFSSSLPIDIQLEALRTIPALADVQLFRPGYAIEYDFFYPTQLRHTLEAKVIPGLYLAGQVNGTTGYEEAAGQGLVAGVNAALAVQGREPFTLGRDQAYIGVLIDDLVTKGVDEPYRMFTSRAEHRILLRQDDADMRLTPLGHAIGLATDERYEAMLDKRRRRDGLIEFTRSLTVSPSLINGWLTERGEMPLRQGVPLHDLILRPGLNISLLAEAVPALREYIDTQLDSERAGEIVEAAEILMKYQGYIQRERANADKLRRLESLRLRGHIDYASVAALSTEARQKLQRIDPETIGQASRIPGISPADVNILLLLLGR
ncbi:MAG: tRNA uridine-5-carboxymethylaminomethyl(34) synthesis enzyme MnmG, partial [Duncaniella sp.]|nr:tRNA uridine-5-carboxymethylaminomethyl(34) synthesis enzyme MnmG [Duncaniella sp.]